MASRLTEITAIPVDEKFRDDSFCIVTAKQKAPVDNALPLRFALYGDADPGELVSQLPYHFWGSWDAKQYNGETQHIFRHTSFAAIEPHGEAGIVAYVQQARNVGPKVAYALHEKYGSNAVRMLRENPEQAAAAIGVKRFTPERAREAAEDLERLKVAENLTIQLYDLFHGRGFGKACVRQALKLWGANAHEILTRDPHRAMALRGVGFLKADRFYLDLGKPPEKLKRQGYCLTYSTLKESDQQGHTWVPWQNGIEYLKAAVAGAEVKPEKALTLAVRGKILRTCRDERGQLWTAHARRANAEEYCCQKIVEAMTE